jgi:hypothetical protein
MVAVTDSRYQGRIGDNEEFKWLLNDITEYNIHAEEKSVSLLESVGREKMAESEAKRAERKEKRKSLDPLLSDDSVLAVSPNPEGEADLGDAEEVAAEDEEEEEDEGPDLLLREAARIVADMAELESDLELLEHQFSQLNSEGPGHRKIN